MRRHFNKHLCIVMRPDGVSQGKALVQQGLAPAGDLFAIRKAYGRYRYWLHSWMDYYNISRKALRKFAFSGGFQLPEENFSAFNETQYCDDCQPVCEDCEAAGEFEDASLRVGDIVIASYNYNDRGIDVRHNDVVQIQLIAGSQACVKTRSGNMSIHNLVDLLPIPKSF